MHKLSVMNSARLATIMTDLPAPLTPPDCDLRGYDYMPLFGSRLFGSRLYTKAFRQPRAGLAAIKLWWMAWQQCPAGSLPDDDDDLAMLADFGTDSKGWRAVREIALHGFVKCSDGRLYHPILCEEAQGAFERRKKERERKAKLRSKKTGTDDGSPAGTDEGVPPPVPRDSTGTSAVSLVSSDGRGQDRTGQDLKKEEEREPVASLPRASDPCDEAVSAWNEMAERHGLSRVSKLTDTRRRSLRQRLTECDGIEGWSDAMRLVTKSPHLLGHSRGGWKADFDFVLQQRSFVKLMEGAYGNRGQAQAENGWDLYDRHVEQEAARESDRLSH